MSKKRLFSATNQPSQLVNQKEILHTVKNAIYRDDDSCQIVVLRGEGGLGKTRLLEEILRRLNHQETVMELGSPPVDDNWSQIYSDKVLPSKLLDFMDVKLHARDRFIDVLGDSNTWSRQVNFSKFDSAKIVQRRQEEIGAPQLMRDIAAQQTEEALWQDYNAAANHQRLIIPLDTTEQLSLEESSRLFIEWGVLKPEDVLYGTQQWLLAKIGEGKFKNTTLLIAGREKEGSVFFKELKEVVKKTKDCFIEWKDVKSFGEEEIKQYFEALKKDWRQETEPEAVDMRRVLDDLLGDEDQLKLLALYTEGKPIYLSLYTEILVESRRIPEPLQQRFEEAAELSKNDLEEARKKIQSEFVRMLFYRPSLRSQIMQLLARATWGVTAEQIHFVLDSKPQESIISWTPDPIRLAEIERELEAIMRFSLVKKKPGKRIGLQDEVYDIFAQYMLRSEATRQAEIKERQKVYSRLRDWAKYHHDHIQAKMSMWIEEDINRIRIADPEDALNADLPEPLPREQKERDILKERKLDFNLEAEHYKLLAAPEEYIDLFFLNQISSRLELDEGANALLALLSTSIWRLLKDRYAFFFVNLKSKHSLTPEQFVEDYKRRLRQDEAAAWILRFYTRKEYKGAIAFAYDIDEAVNTKIADKQARKSWNSRFIRGQRLCWRAIAEIYEADDIAQAVEQVKVVMTDLEALANTSPNQVVFSETGETGYQGTDAAKRLHVIIANGYNVIGYGLANIGSFWDAISAYGEALKHLRQLPTEEQSYALQATVLNNLSRTLVELGKRRAVRICLDGLELRLKEGGLTQIALSYNTLGLIYNDLLEPRKAMEACGKANAIARKQKNQRLQGLVSIQLAESFRRQARTDLVVSEWERENFYRKAEEACEQALSDFAGDFEPLRRIEAEIETGCLYRDWMEKTDKEADYFTWQERRDKAIGDSAGKSGHLIKAVQLAREHDLTRLELDTLVNIAWTYYYAGDFDKGYAVLDEVDALTPAVLTFVEHEDSPVPDIEPAYYLKLLSKAFGLRGRMLVDTYKEKVVEFRDAHLNLTPEERQQIEFTWQNGIIDKLLNDAAIAYVKGIAYAQLLSPRSQTLSIIYDFIYHRVRKMNPYELARFSYHVNEAQSTYRIDDLKLENLGNVSNFLAECFGEYSSDELPLRFQGELL